jgi:hypothetical protein
VERDKKYRLLLPFGHRCSWKTKGEAVPGGNNSVRAIHKTEPASVAINITAHKHRRDQAHIVSVKNPAPLLYLSL